MSSTVSYVKSGTIIQCSTSSLPRPRPQTAWPIPVFPSTGNSFLALAIQGVKNNSAQAVVVTTPVALPGSASAVWTLYWTAYQGSAPPVLSWHSVSVPSSGLGTGLMLLPPNDATVVAYLQRGEAGQTSTYAQVSISTPPLALTDVGYLAPSEQLAVVLQWNQTQALKTTLDAAASALSVSSASYDASIATLSSNLIAATAPANWATAWPSTDIFASAGIKTNLATWWAAIASPQTALQSALANAAAIATGAGAPTAIGDGVTTTYIWGGGTVKINGVTTAAYTTSSGLLTFTAAPSMGALLQGVSTNAQQGVTQINSLDYLTNIDKIILMQDWNSEASIQTALDTQATTLSITTEKTNYDSAVTALSTSIISAGAPANWATIWPDGTIWNHSGIMTSLKSWWASIASTRTLLMNKISNTVLTLGGSTATWGSITGASAQASPAGGWTGNATFNANLGTTGTFGFIGSSAGAGMSFRLQSAAGNARYLDFYSGAYARWSLLADSSAETGSLP